ncbi:cytochrome b [Glaciecola sp. MH2013]|uniref:cytochrome b n=1 Tax=Glaciecola sp. MH2013 TaxID=2785524 RepID=UPI0018A0442D|nr:cytochrome b [Glaciecola sp. MH2013]MBF7073893.1 cytochrome b [Glaciecola sp. MH2013]
MASALHSVPSRYHSISIVLHWAVVLGLIFMFISGIMMVYVEMSKAEQYKLFQIHKAAGVVMLWAIVVRIAVRLLTTSPTPPSELSASDLKKATLGHIALYTALVLMPLSGWLMVSASPFGLPTFVFVDWIKWPHISGVARNKAIESAANSTHWITAIALFILIIGHISAVIWHKKVHKINLLTRMWWRKKPSE